MLRTVRGTLWVGIVAALIASACGGTAQPSPSAAAPSAAAPTAAPKTAAPTTQIGSAARPIVLAITPSAEVARLTTTGNAIAAALGKATNLTWKVQVPTSYAAQIEAVCSGQVDVAFIAPLQMTLLLDKGCGTPIIAALRNDETCKLSATYNSQILVRADSGINDLAGLKGKKFAFVDAISASGSLFPQLLVKQKTGQDAKTFFASTINAGGHPQSVLALYNGQVDGAASFGDARLKSVCGTPEPAAGMPADILAKTKIIDKAGPIPNDGIAVAKALPADVVAAIKKALVDYAGTDEGKKNYKDLFAWDGLQEVQASFYDSMRDAAKLGGVDVAGEAAKTPRPPATVAPSPTAKP
jgi:phosphonate transport system substrate-binding protein